MSLRNAVEDARWTPVRRGQRYCSPGCGADCTHAEFVSATKSAEVLAEQLGDEWKPRVWENLGWHWSAMRKDDRMEVMRCPLTKSYTAFLRNAGSGPGGAFTGSGSSAHDAVAAVIKRCRARIERFEAMVEGME